ncbi:MAG: hypothetical protein ACR2NR_22565 [Solirubrobacteraceae bacterium]
MTPGPLLIDGLVAVAAAALVLIVAPGVAIVAMLALLVLVVCALSVLPAWWRGRRPGGLRRRRVR